jgi:hypothetical protein
MEAFDPIELLERGYATHGGLAGWGRAMIRPVMGWKGRIDTTASVDAGE